MTQRKALGRKMYTGGRQSIASNVPMAKDDDVLVCFTESEFESVIRIAVEAGEHNIDGLRIRARTWSDIWPELKKRLVEE